MLTHAKSPYGSTSVEAASVPAASERPQPWPVSSIRRQSASFWFQFADFESATQPARCCSPRRCSVLSIPGFEMRRLAKARLAPRHPVRYPIDHRPDRDSRRAEKPVGGGGVEQPSGLRFLSRIGGLPGEALAEFFREPPHADFRSAEVD